MDLSAALGSVLSAHQPMIDLIAQWAMLKPRVEAMAAAAGSADVPATLPLAAVELLRERDEVLLEEAVPAKAAGKSIEGK